jgi:hypothetical protein
MMLMRNDGRREFCLPSDGQFEEKKKEHKKTTSASPSSAQQHSKCFGAIDF